MVSNRDDFTQETKDRLAKRVGFRCSSPECRKPTVGPRSQSSENVNIGVAAHICAAAKGGKRYNANMTPEERKSIHNGIWLCQNCAKLIDNDENRYTVSLINLWKSYAEELALLEIQTGYPINTVSSDVELIEFYSKFFNRPAFQDPIREEGCMENFERAIEDTIIALNTGILRDQHGDLIDKSAGINEIKNNLWREKLYVIVDILLAIKDRLRIAHKDNLYRVCDNGSMYGTYIFYDNDLADWFDSSRNEIINILSSICIEAGLPEYNIFPRKRHRF